MERTGFPEKCEFCNGDLKVWFTDNCQTWPTGVTHFFNYSAYCCKCCAHFSMKFIDVALIKDKEQIGKSLQHINECFLCHKPIDEEEREIWYQDATHYRTLANRFDPHLEKYFFAHEKCSETVGDPFLRNLRRQHERRALDKYGDKDAWIDSDVKERDMEELKFIKVVTMLNQNEPIRKIAESLDIDRNRVWRVAKNIEQLKKAQSL